MYFTIYMSLAPTVSTHVNLATTSMPPTKCPPFALLLLPAPPQPRALAFCRYCNLRARYFTLPITTRCYKWEDYQQVDEDVDVGGVNNLEAQILEFMTNSSKPEAFPSRKELVEAGRGDLAEAIVEKGGWLSLGWDSEEEEEDDDDDIDDEMFMSKYRSFDEHKGEEQARDRSTHKSFLELMDQSSEMGIEGILNRLEKQRNFAFGIEDKLSGSTGNVVGEDDQSRSEFSTDTTVAGIFRIGRSTSLSHEKSISDDSEDIIDASIISDKPQMWKSWSIQRPGLSDIDTHQDTEVTPSEVSTDATIDIPKYEEQEAEIDNENNEQSEFGLEREEIISHNRLRRRLQLLELELSSVLSALRSNDDEIVLNKYHESLSENLQKVYDSWEFQENEIMKAQNQLRSTRAKLAVLEGKIALAIIEAQKIIEEKQNRIDDALRALRLVHSTCIVWPNPASEVLLAGSFDGWATLRQMDKTSIGIFSLWLQLYPGKYEIKFIVDGEWRTDPQRPIVNNNGHLNNLLIIS